MSVPASLVSLTSNLSKEERVAHRRRRVQDSIEAKRSASPEDSKKRHMKTEDGGEISTSEQQIANSKLQLEKKKEDGTADVTMVRIEGDRTENDRRMAVEVQSETRNQKLSDEAANASKRNAAVSMKWATLYDAEVPQTLAEELSSQQEACDRIVASKNRLISEFQDELRQKDAEYVASLRQQADDVESVISKMKRHTREMLMSFRSELEEIEKAFLEERRQLLTSNREQLDALYEQRRALEKSFLEKRLQRADEQGEELDRIREKDSQDYNQLKIDLQKDIQELEQEAEEMRSRYLLNSEKLDYNFRVLSERVVDNKHTITQNKRKLARLQDALSVVVGKYHKADKQYKAENQELTDMYARITEQFKDLQLKFKQFERQDLQQYKEVWKMNEEHARGLISKLFDADRVMTQHQLGMTWVPPTDDNFVLQTESFDLGRESASRGGGGGSGASEAPPSAGAAAFRSSQNPGRPLTENVRKMLQMLCDEGGFLAEEKVMNALADVEKNEQNLLKIDSILRTLGVETQAEIESMLPYFTKASPGEDPTRAPMIAADDVVKAIRHFVEDQQRQAARQANVVTLTAEERAAKRRREQEREFWIRLGDCIPEGRQRLWNSLEVALDAYHGLLVSRANLLQETDGLRQQNDELRALLDQYMSAKINEELYVPPALGGLYRS